MTPTSSFRPSPQRDGMLTVPTNAKIHDVGNPDWQGAEVGKAVKHKITRWKSKSSDPLFKNPTLGLADINQECVGDCWYLAALLAIIHHPQGNALIKRTMVDRGDGSAVVRLYDGDHLPVYLRIEKSVAWYLGSGKVHASGLSKTGLWPAILEKAATCFDKASEWKTFDPQQPHYKNIEGGNSHHAFRMLLGVGVTQLPQSNLNATGKRHGGTAATDHLQVLFATGNWNFNPGRECLDALNAIFGFRGMSVEGWKAVLQGLRARNSPLIRGAEGFKIGSQGYGDQFFQLMNSPGLTGLPQDVSRTLADYARKHHVFSGALGTGTYSDGATNLFRTVQANLAAHKPMCFGTVQNIGAADGRGHSAGESVSRGLVGGHAYAVLGTFEENVMQRRKYVKIANPWGRTGRTYQEAPGGTVLTPQEQESGISWIELRDFAGVIQNLYVCEQEPGQYLQFT